MKKWLFGLSVAAILLVSSLTVCAAPDTPPMDGTQETSSMLYDVPQEIPDDWQSQYGPYLSSAVTGTTVNASQDASLDTDAPSDEQTTTTQAPVSSDGSASSKPSTQPTQTPEPSTIFGVSTVIISGVILAIFGVCALIALVIGVVVLLRRRARAKYRIDD